MSGRIHFNPAGAGVSAPAASTAIAEHLAAEAELGPDEAEEARAEDLTERVYARIGSLVKAPASHIALFGSATDGWCREVCGLQIKPGSRIWITQYEYAANLIALQRLARRLWCSLEVMPSNADGGLDLDWVRHNIDDRVALVSVVHMPSAVGLVQPVEALGALLAGSNAVYVVDACQTVGQLPIDVNAIGCHILTAAGRKFLRGPRRTGFAVIRPDLWQRITPPFSDLHVAKAVSLQEHRIVGHNAAQFETAERNDAVVLGLLAAVEHALTEAPVPRREVNAALTVTVRNCPGVRLLAPGRTQSGIVSFLPEHISPEQVRAELTAAGINSWFGIGAHTPLYLTAIRRQPVRALLGALLQHPGRGRTVRSGTEPDLMGFVGSVLGAGSTKAAAGGSALTGSDRRLSPPRYCLAGWSEGTRCCSWVTTGPRTITTSRS